MPRIVFNGIETELIKRFSTELEEQIVKLLGCPGEYITMQVNRDFFIRHGAVIRAHPYIEVSLFEREETQEDELAKLITEVIRKNGISEIDIYLTHLIRRRYYESGEHF